MPYEANGLPWGESTTNEAGEEMAEPLCDSGLSSSSGTTAYWVDENKKEEAMRGLYVGYVVEGAKGEVVFDGQPRVFNHEHSARLFYWAQFSRLHEGIPEPDDYDIVVHWLGDVRAKA